MSNVKTMEGLFDGSYNIYFELTKDMEHWNIEKCSNFRRAFALGGTSSKVSQG